MPVEHGYSLRLHIHTAATKFTYSCFVGKALIPVSLNSGRKGFSCAHNNSAGGCGMQRT